MSMARSKIMERLDAFRKICEEQGIKLTHQRTEIFREVISTDAHPDALTVYRKVKKRIPAVSLDTVYRNLKLFEQIGAIGIVGMSQESLRFDGNMHPHHHFACVKCGMIRDFTLRNAEGLDMPKEVRTFGAVLSLHLEVKGVCVVCQKEGEVSNRTKGKQR